MAPSFHHAARVVWGSLAIAAGLAGIACDASDNSVDPADLQLRDLLGFDPEVAAGWDGDQRAAARAVLGDGLAVAEIAPSVTASFDPALDRDGQLIAAIGQADRGLADGGHDALGLVRVAVTESSAT